MIISIMLDSDTLVITQKGEIRNGAYKKSKQAKFSKN